MSRFLVWSINDLQNILLDTGVVSAKAPPMPPIPLSISLFSYPFCRSLHFSDLRFLAALV